MNVSFRPAESSEPRFDLVLHCTVVLFSVLVQATAALFRIGVSYRVLELGLPVIWLGVISSAFAVIPLVVAVQIGRFIDRGYDAQAAWIGSALVGASCVAIFYTGTSPYMLAALNAVFGLGYMFLMISLQILCLRSARADMRDQAFGNYMAANAIGQGIGPLVVTWLAGSAMIPDTVPILGWGMVLAVAMAVLSFALRPSTVPAISRSDYVKMPVGEIVRIPGLMAVMLASVMAITAQDLITIYLPLVGTERGIAAAYIGGILTVRSVASLVSRLMYARLVSAVGHWPLMIISIAASAVAFVVMAAPVPIWVMGVASAVIGFGLGVATTLSITMVVQVAPESSRATAMTLRISGNRAGQILLPLIASLVAGAAGAWGILAMIALSLAGSSAAVFQASPYSQPLRRK